MTGCRSALLTLQESAVGYRIFKGAVARNVRFQSLVVARAIKKNLNETFEDLAMCPAN